MSLCMNISDGTFASLQLLGALRRASEVLLHQEEALTGARSPGAQRL